MLRVSSCRYLHLNVIRITILALSLIGGGNYRAHQASQEKKTADTVKKPDRQEAMNSQDETEDPVAYPMMANSAFVGADRVWLVGPLARPLQRTEDAGKSWQTLTSDEISKYTVLSFIDQNNGWRVGKSSSEAGQVWRTTDGGKSWTKISIIVRDHNPFSIPKQLHFSDRTHGWLLDMFGVFRTEDGGVSWVEVLSGADPRVKGQPTRGFFINERQAWVAGTSGKIYVTADGGTTWDIQHVDSGTDFDDIFFVDGQTGWLGRTQEGQLYRTDDGGDSWHLQPVPGPMISIKSFYFLSKNEGWAVGEKLLEGSRGLLPYDYVAKGLVEAILLHTEDGGRTWRPSLVKKDDAYFGQVYFSDPRQGWLLSPKNLYRTTDGGRSWKVLRQMSTE